ncbi:MAG: hypothetical protein K2X03_24190 [Bryobacteraceae bacterium]|nr:hypothetical protein [Bryobacteraceae bacterium]
MSHVFRNLSLLVAFALPLVGQPIPSSQVRLNQGETLGIIRVVVRPNFISPSTVTVEEGLYQIVVHDAELISNGASIDFEDERGATSRQGSINKNEPRSSSFRRLTPGVYKLKLGAKSEWTLQLTVTAKRTGAI